MLNHMIEQGHEVIASRNIALSGFGYWPQTSLRRRRKLWRGLRNIVVFVGFFSIMAVAGCHRDGAKATNVHAEIQAIGSAVGCYNRHFNINEIVVDAGVAVLEIGLKKLLFL